MFLELREIDLSPEFYYYTDNELACIEDAKKRYKLLRMAWEFDKIIERPQTELFHLKEGCAYHGIRIKLHGTIENGKIIPRLAPLSKEVVKSSLHRWIHHYGSRKTHYFLNESGEIVSCGINKHRSRTFTMSGLTEKEKETYKNIVYENWDEIIGPLISFSVLNPPTYYKDLQKLFSFFPPSPEHIIETDIHENDLKLLDKYPRYSSIKINLTLKESLGVFVSSFVYFPDLSKLYEIALEYLSKKDVYSLIKPLKEIFENIYQSSLQDKISKAIQIYHLFSQCTRNREIYFHYLLREKLENNDDCPEELCFSELSKGYQKIEPTSERVFSTYTPSFLPQNVKFKKCCYKSLVYGPSLPKNLTKEDFLEDDTLPSIYTETEFSIIFKSSFRCYNPEDIEIEDETLYSRGMEMYFRYFYYGIQ